MPRARRGCAKLPCIEKIADDAETLELALIENLQRKDLTRVRGSRRPLPAGRAVRLHARGHRPQDRQGALFGHRDAFAAQYSRGDPRGAASSSGIVSKSLLLQIARQPNEKKMAEMVAAHHLRAD